MVGMEGISGYCVNCVERSKPIESGRVGMFMFLVKIYIYHGID